jgi:hypothetical protein
MVIITPHIKAEVTLSMSNSIDILSVPVNRPDKLFSFDSENRTDEVRKLLSIWHPDRSTDPNATDVFKHIQQLKKSADEQIQDNTWATNGAVLFTCSKTKKIFKFKYLYMKPFELGHMYVNNTKVLYVVKDTFTKLFDNGVKVLQSIKYPAAKYEKEFKKYLPSIAHISKDTNIGHVLIVDKTEDVVQLSNLLQYLPDNKLLPRHTAWIISSLLNTCCFLYYIGISHNAILTDTMFVSPQYHSVVMLGGWWYANPINNKLVGLPAPVINSLPSSVLSDKISKLFFDSMLIKSLAIECLGDTTRVGSKLLKDKDIPGNIVQWLRASTFDNPVTNYKNWDKVLDAAYGKRTFIKLDVDIKHINQI